MPMMTKTSGVLVTGLLLVAGWATLNLGAAGPGQEPARRHAMPPGTRRGATVRLFTTWSRPDTPNHINVWAGGVMSTYPQQTLPATVGRWWMDYSYRPGNPYLITTYQENSQAGATDCEITVNGISVDKDRIVGAGQAHCWVNP